VYPGSMVDVLYGIHAWSGLYFMMQVFFADTHHRCCLMSNDHWTWLYKHCAKFHQQMLRARSKIDLVIRLYCIFYSRAHQTWWSWKGCRFDSRKKKQWHAINMTNLTTMLSICLAQGRLKCSTRMGIQDVIGVGTWYTQSFFGSLRQNEIHI